MAILCFYRVIPSLSYMYNLVFIQCLLSGESARIRILMGLSTMQAKKGQSLCPEDFCLEDGAKLHTKKSRLKEADICTDMVAV